MCDVYSSDLSQQVLFISSSVQIKRTRPRAVLADECRKAKLKALSKSNVRDPSTCVNSTPHNNYGRSPSGAEKPINDPSILGAYLHLTWRDNGTMSVAHCDSTSWALRLKHVTRNQSHLNKAFVLTRFFLAALSFRTGTNSDGAATAPAAPPV
jgi:hypothetical protein